MTTPPDATWVVGVVGAGAMGSGIAQVAATEGHRTLLLDVRDGAAEAAVAGVVRLLRRAVERGRLDRQQADAAVARLEVARDLTDLAGCDLVVEAVVEDLAVKQALLLDLEAVVAPDAVLASNTSSLSVDDLAAPLAHPGRLAGLHFFNPVPLMHLVEVAHGTGTDPAVVDRLVDLVSGWGKVAVTCTSTPGFVVNRIARPYYGEAFRLLASTDLTPATVDALLRESGGFPMGPLELTDLIGHDVNAAVNASVWHAMGEDPRFSPSPVQDALVAAGRFGRKTGSGFYEHGDGTEVPAPATLTAAPGRPAAGWWPHPSVRALAARAGLVDHEADPPDGTVALRVTDGRTAAEVERATGRPTVLLDLARDQATCTRVGATASPGCPEGVLEALAAVLTGAGVAVTALPDLPGLVVARTAATVVAAAEEAVESGVALREHVDLAMEHGSGHPVGPLAWGEQLGAAWVVGVMDALHADETDPGPTGRYRVCPTLRGRAMLSLDRVSTDLGLTLVEAGAGRGVVRGEVTARWLNGFGIVHGGTVCTVADTALAVACNGAGELTVGASLDVTWVSPGRVGDVLLATAVERARYGRNGVYDITVTRADGSLVAEVRGRTRTVGGPVPTTLLETS